MEQVKQDDAYWRQVEEEVEAYWADIENDPVKRAERKLELQMLKEEIRRGLLPDEVFF